MQAILSPLISILISTSFFTAFILIGKYLVLSMPLPQLIFFYLIFTAAIDLLATWQSIREKIRFDQVGIQLILSFAYLGFLYCFFGSLTHLPLASAVAIYLSYPLIVPWILRIWMGKRVGKLLALGSYIAWIGVIFSFNHKLQLRNVLVFVAIFGALFKALYQTGYARMKISEPPLVLWITKYLCALLASTALLVGSWQIPHWQKLLSLLLICILEKVYKASFSLSIEKSNLFKTIYLFSSSIFLCAGLDYLIFNSLVPFKSLMCALLIYLGIFFTFLQKNVLSNSVYDL